MYKYAFNYDRRILDMEKVKEFISYGIVGVMTTLVNYIVYFISLKIGINWLISNSLAWLVAVIFAYFSNRKVVFHSSNDVKKECIEFFGLRFMTLIVENVLLAACIDGLHISNLLSKILVSIITVFANYFLCKSHIFSKKGEMLYE